MKIDSEQLLATVNKFKTEQVDRGETAAAGGKKVPRQETDRVDLSLDGTGIDRLKAAMQKLPDVRSEKVAQLKERVASGTYRVDSRAVAEKMLAHLRELHA